MKKCYRVLSAIMILMVGAVAFRMYLPTLVKNITNEKLAHLEPYCGHVEGVDLSLLLARVTFKELKIDKIAEEIPAPFFKAEAITVALDWRALLKRRVVARLLLDSPELNFVRGASSDQSQIAPPDTSKDVGHSIVPIAINSIEIRDGKLRYIDSAIKPQLRVMMHQVRGTIANLTNVQREEKNLFSMVKLAGEMENRGHVDIEMHLNPQAIPVRFAFAGSLRNMDLSELNPFFQAYGHFDVKKGSLDVFTELAANGKTLDGYVKPMVKDLQVIDARKDLEKGFFHLVWQSIVGAAAQIVENRDKDDQAAKIPLHGPMDDPKVGVFASVISVLKNGFVNAIPSGVEGALPVHKTSHNK